MRGLTEVTVHSKYKQRHQPPASHSPGPTINQLTNTNASSRFQANGSQQRGGNQAPQTLKFNMGSGNNFIGPNSFIVNINSKVPTGLSKNSNIVITQGADGQQPVQASNQPGEKQRGKRSGQSATRQNGQPNSMMQQNSQGGP